MAAAPGFQAGLVGLPNPPSLPNTFIILLFQSEQSCALRKLHPQRSHRAEGCECHPESRASPQGVTSPGSGQPALQPVSGTESPLRGLCLHSLSRSWGLAPHLWSLNQNRCPHSLRHSVPCGERPRGHSACVPASVSPRVVLPLSTGCGFSFYGTFNQQRN